MEHFTKADYSDVPCFLAGHWGPTELLAAHSGLTFTGSSVAPMSGSRMLLPLIKHLTASGGRLVPAVVPVRANVSFGES